MEKVKYNEPEFNVVITCAEDVITTSDISGGNSNAPETPGQFVTPPVLGG